MKKIKKIVAITIVLFTYFSCEWIRTYDCFIINKCQDSIRVEIKLGDFGENKKVSTNLIIAPDSTKLFFSAIDYQPLSERYLEAFFEEIIIIKGNDTLKINYADKDLWDFQPNHKKCYAESYLTVNPEDFE